MTEEQEGGAPLEERLKRLETILARLEAEEVPLEEAMRLFEEGVTHVRAAEEVLSATAVRVEELLESGESRPMAVEEE